MTGATPNAQPARERNSQRREEQKGRPEREPKRHSVDEQPAAGRSLSPVSTLKLMENHASTRHEQLNRLQPSGWVIGDINVITIRYWYQRTCLVPRQVHDSAGTMRVALDTSIGSSLPENSRDNASARAFSSPQICIPAKEIHRGAR